MAQDHAFPLGEEGMHSIDGTPCACMAQTRGNDHLVIHNSMAGADVGLVCRAALEKLMLLAQTGMSKDDWHLYERAIDVLTLHWPEGG